MDMEQFRQDREVALRSLDAEKVKDYMVKYGMQVPDDEKVLWIAIHKARANLTSLSVEERKISTDWLIERGYKTTMF